MKLVVFTCGLITFIGKNTHFYWFSLYDTTLGDLDRVCKKAFFSMN